MKAILVAVSWSMVLTAWCGRDASFRQAEAALSQIRARADLRIAAIRATPNLAIPTEAPKRYLSNRGDDAADGLTPETAWCTIDRLNREKLAAGTFVLFARGGFYRGTVKTCPGVTYTAWGGGPKPIICGSSVNGADPSKWKRTEVPNIWSYAIGHRDVGTLIFNEGEQHAIKVVFKTDAKTGAHLNLATGKPFESYRDLEGDLHFYHDYFKDRTGNLYLVSERNPGERFRSIEFNERCCGFWVGENAGVTIDNFTVKYVGIHGVSTMTCRDLTVSNCEFGWIGGSIQAEGLFGRNYPTRFGNAVEIYGGCENYAVTNCYIYQVYDAGVTHQFNIPEKEGMKLYDQRHVRYIGNVIEKCNYSIEYFLTALNGNESRQDDILFEDNLLFDAGYGFCEQRPDRKCGAHIRAWQKPNRNRATNYRIVNNAFCNGMDALVTIYSGLKNKNGESCLPKMTGNVFIGRKGGEFGQISEDLTAPARVYDESTQAFVDRFGPGNRCLFTP